MTEFRFTNEHTAAQVADIADLLHQPRLWIPTAKNYPDYTEWIHKSEGEINAGAKQAMVAYMGKAAIGTVIYQRHPERFDTLEIRNISVTPDARGRYIGAFLLRNSELEAAEHDYPGIDKITIDTKESNEEMIGFLRAQGYRVTNVSDLYGLGAGLDVTLSKSLHT